MSSRVWQSLGTYAFTGLSFDLFDGTGNDKRGFLKFDVSGVAPDQSAFLRLHASVLGAADTIRIRGAWDNSWTETGVT